MASHFLPKIPFVLLKKMQKQPYNLAIRFTLVIIINNECVSNYAYAAATVLNGILKTCIFHLHLRDAAPKKLEND